jgi:hypothetical protein
MPTVSPIIPSIEPDKTSLTVSVMDDEGGLATVCSSVNSSLVVVKFGWIFGVVKFGWIFGVVKFGWIFGVVKFGWIFGVVKFGCALVSPLVAIKAKLKREMA